YSSVPPLTGCAAASCALESPFAVATRAARRVAARSAGPATPAARPMLTKTPVPTMEPSPSRTAPGSPTSRRSAPAPFVAPCVLDGWPGIRCRSVDFLSDSARHGAPRGRRLPHREPRDVRGHHRDGRLEVVDLDPGEAGCLDRLPRAAVRVAPVGEQPPERPHHALEPGPPAAPRVGDVLDEGEPPARPEDAPDLPERALEVAHATENERADDGVDRPVVEGERLRPAEPDLGAPAELARPGADHVV